MENTLEHAPHSSENPYVQSEEAKDLEAISQDVQVLSEDELLSTCAAPDVSLVIPAHNEEHRIGPILESYTRRFRERYGDAFEVVVVVNGSSDRTAEIALEVSRTHPEIRVFNVHEAVGKGGAVMAGFAHARGSRIVFADADGATDPASLFRLVENLGRSDIAIGSRRLPESVILNPQPLARRIFSRAFNLAVRKLFALPYRDTQCGAKAFRSETACELTESVDETRWAFDVDLLLTAEKLGMRVVEVPVVWTDIAGSRLRVLPTLKEVGRALWRLRSLRDAPGRVLAARRLRERIRCGLSDAPSVLQAAGPLRILALNWRCQGHPQAGGAELNLFEQTCRWADEGHDVTAFCSLPGNGPREFETDDDVRIKRLGDRFSIYPMVAMELIRHGREFDRIIDVANGIPFFAPLFTRTPVTLLVHHVHGRQWFEEFPRPIAAFGWFLERYVVPLVYRNRPVIAVSPTTRDALVSTGFSPDQIRVVYNGISQPEELPEVSRAEQHVAYLGRIKRYKRLDRLVEAVARLRHEFPGIRLDIAGDGDARSELEELVAHLGVDDVVSIRGFVDEEQKARILAGATVFATPSMHEGWGLSVIEANSYGCPAVAYDVPGLRVAIRDGETGFLAHSDDEFREGIARLIRDPLLHVRYSEASKEWASRFDWDSAAKDTLRVLAADSPLLPVAPAAIQELAA